MDVTLVRLNPDKLSKINTPKGKQELQCSTSFSRGRFERRFVQPVEAKVSAIYKTTDSKEGKEDDQASQWQGDEADSL